MSKSESGFWISEQVLSGAECDSLLTQLDMKTISNAVIALVLAFNLSFAS
jgi:hypothetical protein